MLKIKNKKWIFSGIVMLSLLAGLFFQSLIYKQKAPTLENKKTQIINSDSTSSSRLTLKQYEQGLETQKARLTKELSTSVAEDHFILAVELASIKEKLKNIEVSFHKTEELLLQSEAVLQQYKDKLPKEKFAEALKALREGSDTTIAESAFDEVVKRGSGSIAQAAYQSGQLAENRVDYKKAIKQFTISVTLAENNPDYLLSAGKIARTIANYEQAEVWLERLYQIRQRKGKLIDLAEAQNNLALLYHIQGKYEQAEPLYQRVLEITEKTLEPDRVSVALTLNNLAELYRIQGKYKQAEPLYLRALEITEKTPESDHYSVGVTLHNLATLYHNQGNYEQAEPLYQHALEIVEKALGSDHHAMAAMLNNLSMLYHNQGNYGKAEPLAQRALEINEKVLGSGSNHPSVVATLNNLAGIYHAQGKYEQAEPLSHRALAITKKTLDPEHLSVALALNNLAELYRAQEKYKQAKPLYQRALEITEKNIDPDYSAMVTILNNLAELYYAEGNYEQAELLYQRALDILIKIYPEDHPDFDIVKHNYDLLKLQLAEEQ
jgi:tetratricopeptide (TPR) repeat protein